MGVRLDGDSAPDLAAVLRGAGLQVDETVVPDWRLRSRGGNTQWYSPTQMDRLHIMMHNTATPASTHNTEAGERNEAARMPVHPVARPCGNLYLGPTTGIWYMIAAGPANTNGSGHDWWGGGVPDDAMNSYSIAIEYGNDGVGEPWQEHSWQSYITGIAAMRRAYDVISGRVRCHFEWAPTRKINLSSGPNPQGAAARLAVPGDRYGRFDMDLVRGEIDNLMGGGPAPIPPEENDMIIATVWAPDGEHQFIVGSDRHLYHRARADGSGQPPWEDRGGVWTNDPVAVMQPDGNLAVFGRGADGGVWKDVFVWGVGWTGAFYDGPWPT